MSKHNIVDYALAKEFLSVYPEIEKTLDNSRKELYAHINYMAVRHAVIAIEEAQEALKLQYYQAKKVLDTKGKIN